MRRFLNHMNAYCLNRNWEGGTRSGRGGRARLYAERPQTQAEKKARSHIGLQALKSSCCRDDLARGAHGSADGNMVRAMPANDGEDTSCFHAPILESGA